MKKTIKLIIFGVALSINPVFLMTAINVSLVAALFLLVTEKKL